MVESIRRCIFSKYSPVISRGRAVVRGPLTRNVVFLPFEFLCRQPRYKPAWLRFAKKETKIIINNNHEIQKKRKAKGPGALKAGKPNVVGLCPGLA